MLSFFLNPSQKNLMEKDKEEITAQVETPSGTVDETVKAESPKSGRSVWVERLRTTYPDKDVDYENDDDAFYSGLEDFYNTREDRIRKLDEGNKSLTEALTREPEAGLFLSELIAGSEVLPALAKSYGDILGAVSGDEESMKKFNEGLSARRDSEKSFNEIRAKQEENAARNAETIGSFFEEKSADDAERTAFEAFVSSLADSIFTFNFDRPTLDALWRAYKHDEDVTEAATVAEVKGRNANIELQKRSVKNDGTPNLNRESADRITTNVTVPRSKRRGIFERGEIV